MADQIAVLAILDSEAQKYANAGDANAALMLNHVYMAVDELIEALVAERAMRASECKPSVDVERSFYERTDRALWAVQG